MKRLPDTPPDFERFVAAQIPETAYPFQLHKTIEVSWLSRVGLVGCQQSQERAGGYLAFRDPQPQFADVGNPLEGYLSTCYPEVTRPSMPMLRFAGNSVEYAVRDKEGWRLVPTSLAITTLMQAGVFQPAPLLRNDS